MPDYSTFNTGDITSTATSSGSISIFQGMDGISILGKADAIAEVKFKRGIAPQLAFRYIKSKFGPLERLAIDRRIQKLQRAFDASCENGQDALSYKILGEMSREIKESAIYAKGIRHFVEKDDLSKVKNNIKGGHISDTLYERYTKVIPKEIVKRKKELDGIFDGFVIYHYYNVSLEEKVEKKQKVTPQEKSAMKDPILFGTIKETNRLYFIADWEDEFCDLTFDEILDVVTEGKLTKYPNLPKE